MSFDWKATIGTVAPALAGIFGTPVAGLAVGALCKAFGLEPSPENAAAIAQKAQDGTLSGADWAKIKQAEIDVKVTLRKMDLDYDLESERITANDRDSARKREMVVRDKTPAIGFYVLSIGFFGLIAFFCGSAMKPELKPNPEVMDILKIMVGVLGGAWMSSVNYYYGSTKGSQDDKIMLHNSTPIDQEKR